MSASAALKVTEVSLAYRNKTKASERLSIRSSKEAYDILMSSWDQDLIELQEQFRVLLLDRKSSCLAVSTVASGGISSCIVDLKLVFATAIKACASSIVLAHNHPSGNRTPSNEDKSLTRKFVEAGKILDVHILDHIIVTKDGYTSFADEGELSQGFPSEIPPPF